MMTSNGLLLVDKPKGLTSHDVVAGVRKIINERRVGHAGTLDPMATGLLVLGVGPSTRLLRFAQSGVKRYSGTVRLGVATDSLDADGSVSEQMPVPHLSRDEMNAAAAQMMGRQLQVPPMVSAIKVGGRRLHEMAREGLEVEREPREITVSEFYLHSSSDDALWGFEVECTGGTYVRVLLSDLAQRIGTVGHLSELRRTSSGSLHVDRAVSLEQLSEQVQAGSSPLLPPSAFVADLESTVLSADQERRIRMGQRIEVSGSFTTLEIAAFNAMGALVAILQPRGQNWKPELVLPIEAAGTPG
jgi:tRNA pseudouridine55 synthase